MFENFVYKNGEIVDNSWVKWFHFSIPDEEGVVLYLCCAPLSATLLAGGDIFPRKSEETEGISVIFVSDKNAFSPGLPVISEKQVEMRFVIPLPFDEAFLKDK